jgi:hypothetical protein
MKAIKYVRAYLSYRDLVRVLEVIGPEGEAA